MKQTTVILVILLNAILNFSNAQERKNNFLDSCKIICDKKTFNFNKSLKSDNRFQFNINDSYVKFYFENDTIISKTISFNKKKEIDNLIKNNNFYTINYAFVYDLIYKNISISRLELTCSNDGKLTDKSYKKLLNNFLTGRFISFDKILKIAKANNFTNVYSYLIDEDPRWKGNNFYEEDEKKWKITWTLKEKNILKDGKQSGFKVIKIDAKNGEVLSKFLEFPID